MNPWILANNNCHKWRATPRKTVKLQKIVLWYACRIPNRFRQGLWLSPLPWWPHQLLRAWGAKSLSSSSHSRPQCVRNKRSRCTCQRYKCSNAHPKYRRSQKWPRPVSSIIRSRRCLQFCRALLRGQLSLRRESMLALFSLPITIVNQA